MRARTGANAAARLGGDTILAHSHRGNPQRSLLASGERASSLLSRKGSFFVKRFRLAALTALLVPLMFSACSGGSGGVIPGAASASVGRRPATTLSAVAAKRSTAHVAVTEALAFPGLRAAAVPAPLDPNTPVSQLGVVTLPNLAGQAHIAGVRPPSATRALLRGEIFNHTSNVVTPMSVVPTYNSGGTEGFDLNPGFDDTSAVLTAYGTNQVAIPPAPAGSTYPNEIATTMHAGQQPMDGTTNCLEIATVYQTWYGGPPEANLEVGNWCSQPGNETWPIVLSLDSSGFQNSYIRNLGNGFPDVDVELYQPIGGDGSWHALIYNFSTSQWDDLYHAYGSAGYDPTLRDSWDAFESHYYPGPCPVLPKMATFDFQVAVETGNNQQNYWRAVQPGDVGVIANPNGADCFSDDGSGIGGVYDYSVTSPDSAWLVTDPAPAPLPRPTPIHSPFPHPCWGALAIRKSTPTPQFCMPYRP